MNSALLFNNIKRSLRIWVIFFLILLMYQTVIIGMYDPDNAYAFEMMMEMMPKQMIEAMNFTLIDATLTGFVAGYYYAFIIIMFPMIYVIIMSYSLMAKYVDNGSMGYVLSTPTTRQKVVITQAFTLAGSTIDLLVAVTLSGWIFCAIMFPGMLDIGIYLLLNLGVIFLFYAIGGMTFFCSTLFNEGRKAMAFCVALPVGFFILDMLRNVDDRLNFLRFFTPFTLYDNSMIFEKNPLIYLSMFVLFVIGTIFYTLSVLIFKKKDLTL